MRCELSTENLSAYLDGELDSQQAQRLREHLATCSECRRQAGALSQTATLVRAVPEVDPPADLRQRAARLMAATIEEPTCEQALMWASVHMDGETPVQQVVVLERHLQQCGACRSQARAMERTIALVKGLPEMNPPLRVRAAVRRGMEQRSQRQELVRSAKAAGWFAIAAAAAAVAFGVWVRQPGSRTAATLAPGPSAATAQLPASGTGNAPSLIASAPQEPAGSTARVVAAPGAEEESGARRIGRAAGRAGSAPRARVRMASMGAGGDLLRAVAAAGLDMVALAGPRDKVEETPAGSSGAAPGAAGTAGGEAAAGAEQPATGVQASGESDHTDRSIVEAALADVKQALSRRERTLQPIKAERKHDKAVPNSY